MKVIGVDFSGGDEMQGSGTWITEGEAKNGKLLIECCRPTTRTELENILTDQDLPNNTVVAMDFPFSVPKAFADFWRRGAKRMPDLWSASAADGIDRNRFEDMCDEFVRGQKHGNKHPLRIGDLHSNEPKSCLNKRIVPMTFHGMVMLHRLWESKAGFRVPPLEDSGRNGPVLLEVMPGAALRAFELPSNHYKTVAKTIRRPEIEENRKKILGRLESKSGIGIANLNRFHGTYFSNHDGLDSLVAAVVAARWVLDPHQFRHPTSSPTIGDELPYPGNERCRRAAEQALAMAQVKAARLEGWIYIPI